VIRTAPSLMAHAAWLHVAPLLTVETGTTLASGRAHRRIELDSSGLSEKQFAMVLGVRVQCASCKSSICPFRRRFGMSAGRAARPGRLFCSLTCPLDVNVGCSRGAAASAATAALAAAIIDHRRAPAAAPHTDVTNQLGLRGLL